MDELQDKYFSDKQAHLETESDLKAQISLLNIKIKNLLGHIDQLKFEVTESKKLTKVKDPEFLKLELTAESQKWSIHSLEKKLQESGKLIISL